MITNDNITIFDIIDDEYIRDKVTDNKNNYLVYKHTFPDGKVYIGRTKDKENRWRLNGEGYYLNKELYSAINKVGWNNVTTTILEDNLTNNESRILESLFIILYNSENPIIGYNRTHLKEHYLQYEKDHGYKYKKTHINKKKEIKPKKVITEQDKKDFVEFLKSFTNKRLYVEDRKMIKEKFKEIYCKRDNGIKTFNALLEENYSGVFDYRFYDKDEFGKPYKDTKRKLTIDLDNPHYLQTYWILKSIK